MFGLRLSKIVPDDFVEGGSIPHSTQKKPSRGRLVCVWWRRGIFAPSMALTLRPSASPMFTSASCLRSRTPYEISVLCPQPNKKARTRRAFLFGGGGGNRTPVRRRSAPGATCLVQRSISSRSSTLDKAHRGTSRFCFSGRPTGGNHQRSRDDDPTSTSTGTSGFGAYALSGESVDVVVGV